ncbi:MAG: hypothetical protein ACI8V5_004955, partial [Limisphaerales bacterium]
PAPMIRTEWMSVRLGMGRISAAEMRIQKSEKCNDQSGEW